MGLDFGDYNAYFENQEKKEKQELLDKIKKVQDRLNNKIGRASCRERV